jgi:hypothetical protein
VNRLTPNYADYFSALHAIADLEQYGSLVMVWGKSAFSEKKEAPAKKGAAASTPGGSANESPNDSLMLYFQPDQAAVRPIRGYWPRPAERCFITTTAHSATTHAPPRSA